MISSVEWFPSKSLIKASSGVWSFPYSDEILLLSAENGFDVVIQGDMTPETLNNIDEG